MMYCKLVNLRRCGALTCVLAVSMVLAACGDDDTESNNGALTDGGQTDASLDSGGLDGGGDAGSLDSGGLDSGGGDDDGGQDAGSDAADTGGDEDAQVGSIEIIGDYDATSNGENAGSETITSDTWTIVYTEAGTNVMTIVDYDNDANYAVTQNADDAEFGPSKFNKEVWTQPAADGSFYHCTVTYNEETAEAAATTELTADEGDLEGEGCGGFPWTKLTPQ